MTVDSQRQTGELPAVHEAWLPREHALHRPRHGGRQLTALICALVFFTTPTALWVFGMRPAEIENHKLAGFPNPFSGWDFFTGMNRWATDSLAFRADAIRANDWISRTVFGETAPFDQGGGPPAGPLPGSPTSSDPTTPGGSQTPAGGTDRSGYRRVIDGTDGWLYFGEDISGKCEPKRQLDETVRQLNQLRQAVESSGRKFVLVTVPDKTTMVPEHLPASFPGKGCAAKANPVFWSKVTGQAGALDLRPALQAAANQLRRPVYHPQDTHWTHEGAIQMVRAVSERMRPGSTRTWQIDQTNRTTSEADLPPLIGRKGENQITNYRLEPDGRSDRTQGSVVDFKQPVRRTSDATDGMITSPTLVLGDSFLVAASRYLPAAFSDLTMLAYNQIATDPGQVVRAMADSQIVVVEVVERLVAIGTPPLLDTRFIDTVRQELAARPARR